MHTTSLVSCSIFISFLQSQEKECDETWLEFDSQETSTNVRARTRPAIYLVRMRMELQNYRGYCDETKDDTGTSTVDSSMRVMKRKTLSGQKDDSNYCTVAAKRSNERRD